MINMNSFHALCPLKNQNVYSFRKFKLALSPYCEVSSFSYILALFDTNFPLLFIFTLYLQSKKFYHILLPAILLVSTVSLYWSTSYYDRPLICYILVSTKYLIDIMLYCLPFTISITPSTYFFTFDILPCTFFLLPSTVYCLPFIF